jgi:hypothetical protein
MGNHDTKEKARQADRKRACQGRKYGLKPGDAERMKAEQSYRCAICKETFDANILKARSAVVDHCHTTKVVRGMLCQGCNLGLGAFRDNPIFLTQAINYLMKSRT